MTKQQIVPIKVSSEYSEEELTAISQDIIDYIIKRTEKGNGPGNSPWKGEAGKYSDEYISSLDFKIAGKKKNLVNLTLSGDMLSLLDTIKVSKGKIVIGYPKGDEVNGRVEGNRLGSYGGDPNPKKARDFLLLEDDEIESILKKYPLDDDRKRLLRTEKVLTAMEEAKTYQDQVMGEFDGD